MKKVLPLLTIVALFACNTQNTDRKSTNADTTLVLPDEQLPAETVQNTEDLFSIDSIKAEKITGTATLAENTLKFGKFRTASRFEHDRYPTYTGTEWVYNSAERGEKFIISDVTITSDIKNPLLPCIFLYMIQKEKLYLYGSFNYQFYKWSDYATYLGNYNDNKNDFAYSPTVRFSVGIRVDDSIAINYPLMVLVKKAGSILRQEDRFGTPPVRYDASACSAETNVYDYKSDFIPVAVLNRKNL